MKSFLTRSICLILTLFVFTNIWSDPASLFNQSAQPGKQIWNLKNADIRAIIQTVSLMTGKNFIVDPRVQGKITFISHTPMSANELYRAFLSMLQLLNFSAVQSGRIIKIVPSVDANSINNALATRTQPGNGDELVVRIIPIVNVSAVQLLPALRPLMPEWSSITAYSPSNSLILASTAANINRLAAMITQMDNANTNETAIVTLQHANAANIVNTLNSLENSDRALGKIDNFSIAADKVSNSILVSGNIQNINMLETLIHQIDQQTNINSATNAQVIYLNYLSAKKLAPVLTKLLSQPVTAANNSTNDAPENISIQAEPDNDNALLVQAPRHIMSEITDIIHSLDTKPQQVLVEAIIVKVDESLINQLGVVWGSVNSSGQSTVPVGGDVSSTDNTIAAQLTGGVGFIAGGNLQALAAALHSHGSTNILSTPSVVVLNGQKATISDGQNVGLVNREYDSSNAGSTNATTGNQDAGVPFNTVERTDVTLSLTVTPEVSPNNMLRLIINQKDDSLDNTSTAAASSGNPIIDTSKITTNVLVRSGDILVLGGLIDHEADKQESKIPILGSIPLLGHLFTYNNHNVQKTDLMVFLKPIILSNNLISRDQTMERYHYLRRQEIHAGADLALSPNDAPMLPNKGPDEPLKTLPLPAATLKEKQ